MRFRALVTIAAGTLSFVLVLAASSRASAQEVPVREVVLENGMKVLLVPRPGEPTVWAGWVAKVGSVDERPGITGTAHLFEHMMFKGTRTIGTRDLERDLEIMGELDRIKGELAKEERDLARRHRLGEIDDPRSPSARGERHRELVDEFQALLEEQRELIVKNEFDSIYTASGANGMNAGTTNDFTIYFITVPSNKIELWFWMESDRLLHPVFREFYSERDVVREERRMRVESRPTGRFEEQFEALFWSSSPYGWPVIGWPSDVEAITREEALAFYDRYYAPRNLTACLVGGFDPDEAERLAERYFGRLENKAEPPPPVRTREVSQVAEKRMVAHADTAPQVVLRYHSVADGHVDEYPLVVLAEILSGRTGRLYKSLVLSQGLATSTEAFQRGLKYDGYFELRGTAKGSTDPREVEEALLREIEKLAEEPIAERELQKVKNQITASEFRKLRSSQSLLFDLLVRDAYRGWRTIRDDPAKLLAVTAEDVQRAAREYLRPEVRNVLLYYRRGGDSAPAEAAAASPVPGVDGLSPEQIEHLRQVQEQIAGAPREAVEAAAAQIASVLQAAPEEQRPFLEAMRQVLESRLAELRGEGSGEPAPPSERAEPEQPAETPRPSEPPETSAPENDSEPES